MRKVPGIPGDLVVVVRVEDLDIIGIPGACIKKGLSLLSVSLYFHGTIALCCLKNQNVVFSLR